MLDVHVLISHDTSLPWQRQCLDSIHFAIEQAGFAVTVHEVPGIPGHIGLGRAEGYARGVHPYVTCVDDDDYVLPRAFSQMGAALLLGVSAVCSPELTLQNGVFRPGVPRHHLIAYRRDQLIDHAVWPCCGDIAQIKTIKADAIDLQEATYVHRLYMSSKARVLRRSRQSELERANA